MRRIRDWLRKQTFRLLIWLIRKLGYEADTKALFAEFYDKMQTPLRFNLQAELDRVYQSGYYTGLNSREVPADLMIVGKLPLVDAGWEELDSIMQRNGRGLFYTRHIPVQPPTGRLRG